jgi:hypothetical protein
MKERGGNQTSGIDFFITQERIVFLDTQVPAPTCFTLPCSRSAPSWSTSSQAMGVLGAIGHVMSFFGPSSPVHLLHCSLKDPVAVP